MSVRSARNASSNRACSEYLAVRCFATREAAFRLAIHSDFSTAVRAISRKLCLDECVC